MFVIQLPADEAPASADEDINDAPPAPHMSTPPETPEVAFNNFSHLF